MYNYVGVIRTSTNIINHDFMKKEKRELVRRMRFCVSIIMVSFSYKKSAISCYSHSVILVGLMCFVVKGFFSCRQPDRLATNDEKSQFILNG